MDDQELERYARHILLPEIGGAGQSRLLDARVLVIGAGGLGSPAILYLAAAGVGTIGIIDDDAVDLSNLQRQIVHATARIGAAKTDSARQAVAAINPGVTVKPMPERLTAENAAAIIADYDIVADGSDNFETRFLVNDACYFGKKRWFRRPFSASTASSVPSSRTPATAIPATGACSPNRRRRTWFRLAPRPA